MFSALLSSNCSSADEHTQQNDLTVSTTGTFKDIKVTTFELSSLIFKFSVMKLQLFALLQPLDSKRIVQHCALLRASKKANVLLFSKECVDTLKQGKNPAALLHKIVSFTNWCDHSILNSIVEVCNAPEAAALLTQFDARIDPSQPLTKYPIPVPTHQMVPYDTSTHTVLAVQLNQQLNHSTLQTVLDTRSLIQDTCDVTPHCLQLLAVAETSHTILYWTIPKHVTSLLASKVLQHQNYLNQNGIQQVAVYPGTALVTGSALTVGPFAFFNKVRIYIF